MGQLKLSPEAVTDWGQEWREVEFKDKVELIGIIRGCSAANFEAYSAQTKRIYTIFMTDFLDMVLDGKVNGAFIEGVFEVTKRGKNLGIRLKDVPKRDKRQTKRVYPVTYRIPRYV